MSFCFLREWSQFKPEQWTGPNPDVIKQEEIKDNQIKSVVLPIFLELSEAPTLSDEIDHTYRNRFKQYVDAMRGLDEEKLSKFKQIDWNSQTIVEDLQAIDPAYAKFWVESRILNEEEENALLETLLSTGKGEQIFLHALVKYKGKKNDLFVRCLRKLLEFPAYKDEALRILLMYYKDTHQFDAIESLINLVVECEHELEQESVLLLVYLKVQVLIRKKAYEEALVSLDKVRPLSDNNALFDAIRAQILFKKHVSGESIAKVCEYMDLALGKAKESPLTAKWMQRAFRELKVEFMVFLGHSFEKTSLSDGKEDASSDVKCVQEVFQAQDLIIRREYREAIVIYEKYFFSVWQQANPYYYTGDRPLNYYEKGNTALYLKCLMKLYDNDLGRVILHLQTLLDSFAIPTLWKRSFAEILTREGFNQSLLASSEQLCETMESMGKIFSSIGNIHKNSLNIPNSSIKKSNLTKRIQTNETIAQFLNLFGSNPPKSVRDVSFQQEVTETFCEEFKFYLRNLVETFYHEHETGFEKLSFTAHCKKAKNEKNFAFAVMHYIGMMVTQTGKEPDKTVEDVQNILGNLIYQDSNHKALLILCALSINDLRMEMDYPKLREKFPLEVFLFKGYNFFREKDLDHALKNFKEAYKIDSNHPLVLLGLATFHVCKKEPVVAGLFYQKLVRVDQRLANQAALFALTCLRDANDQEGIKKFLFGLKEIEFQPNREVAILARHLFIDLFVVENESKKALEWLEMYADAEPNDPFILMHRALLLLSEYEDSARIDDPEILFKKALKYFDKKEWSAPLKATFSIKHAAYLSARRKFAEACEIAKGALSYTSNEEILSWHQLAVLALSKNHSGNLQLRKLVSNGFNGKSNHPTYLMMAAWCYLACKIFDTDIIVPLLKQAMVKDLSGRLQAQCYIMMLIIYAKNTSDSSGTDQERFVPDIFDKFRGIILKSSKSQSDLRLLFAYHKYIHYTLDVYKKWMRKYQHLPSVFTNFAEIAKQNKYQAEALRTLKELETEFPKNLDLLTALASLETSKGRRQYIHLCLSLDAHYEPLRYLIARDLYEQHEAEAVEEYEKGFHYFYKKSQDVFNPFEEKFSTETGDDIANYVKSVYRKYQDGRQARKHIKEFLKSLTFDNEWTQHFRKKLVACMESIPKPRPIARPKETVRVEPLAVEIIQKMNIAPSSIVVNTPAPVQQSQVISKSSLEPDQEELELQKRLKQAREESRKQMIQMLDISGVTLERRTRYKEEDIIKTARVIAERCRLTQEEEPIVIPQPKVRERYIPIEQKEIVMPIATTILTQAKPAASKELQQEVFALIPDSEKDRVNQAYSNLSVMQGQLTRVDQPEYHPDLQDYIMQRAMMYQLLRLGEALFPQSASVRKTLSAVYQPTMEKLISSTMIPVIRNQLRHDYMSVTLSKVVNTCRYVVESNLKQNLKLWHDFNVKPHHTAAFIKTIIPESCQVVDLSSKKNPLVFLETELRKLGSLLDKISHDVLAMNPDIVYAVKMSVCILCEAAQREEFKGKIKGLDRFIFAGNKIAHEFGEDCEFYSSDEISLFDIRPYVLLAREIHEVNFPKSTGVLSAKAPVFVMGKKN